MEICRKVCFLFFCCIEIKSGIKMILIDLKREKKNQKLNSVTNKLRSWFNL